MLNDSMKIAGAAAGISIYCSGDAGGLHSSIFPHWSMYIYSMTTQQNRSLWNISPLEIALQLPGLKRETFLLCTLPSSQIVQLFLQAQ